MPAFDRSLCVFALGGGGGKGGERRSTNHSKEPSIYSIAQSLITKDISLHVRVIGLHC